MLERPLAPMRDLDEFASSKRVVNCTLERPLAPMRDLDGSGGLVTDRGRWVRTAVGSHEGFGHDWEKTDT